MTVALTASSVMVMVVVAWYSVVVVSQEPEDAQLSWAVTIEGAKSRTSPATADEKRMVMKE